MCLLYLFINTLCGCSPCSLLLSPLCEACPPLEGPGVPAECVEVASSWSLQEAGFWGPTEGIHPSTFPIQTANQEQSTGMNGEGERERKTTWTRWKCERDMSEALECCADLWSACFNSPLLSTSTELRQTRQIDSSMLIFTSILAWQALAPNTTSLTA